jgi:hypothetical protein
MSVRQFFEIHDPSRSIEILVKLNLNSQAIDLNVSAFDPSGRIVLVQVSIDNLNFYTRN